MPATITKPTTRRREVQNITDGLFGGDFYTTRNALESIEDNTLDLGAAQVPADAPNMTSDDDDDAADASNSDTTDAIFTAIAAQIENTMTNSTLTTAKKQAIISKLVAKYDELVDGLADVSATAVSESYRERQRRLARGRKNAMESGRQSRHSRHPARGQHRRPTINAPRNASELYSLTADLMGGGNFAPSASRPVARPANALESKPIAGHERGKPIASPKSHADLQRLTAELLR